MDAEPAFVAVLVRCCLLVIIVMACLINNNTTAALLGEIPNEAETIAACEERCIWIKPANDGAVVSTLSARA